MATPLTGLPPRCRVLYAARTVIGRGWRYQLGGPFWRLYLNAAAGAEIVHPGGVHALTPGRIHVLPAWGEYASRCHGEVGHVYLHVDPGEPLRDIARSPDPLARRFARPIALPSDPAMEARLGELADSPGRSPVWQLRAQAVALAALVACLDLLPAAERARLDRDAVGDDAVAAAQIYIEDFLHQELSIPRLARHCGLSPAHFGVRFKRRTGTAPQRYLRERRIAVAAERLLAGPEPIDGIAAGCGFANRYHFSRVFAQLMGVGPAAYRRAGRF